MDPILLETLQEVHIQEQFNFLPKVISTIRTVLKKKGINVDQISRKVQPQVKKFVSELKKSDDSATATLMKAFYDLVLAIKSCLDAQAAPITSTIISAIIVVLVANSMINFVASFTALLLLCSPILLVGGIVDAIISLFRQSPPDQKAKIMLMKKRMEAAISAAISS